MKKNYKYVTKLVFEYTFISQNTYFVQSHFFTHIFPQTDSINKEDLRLKIVRQCFSNSFVSRVLFNKYLVQGKYILLTLPLKGSEKFDLEYSKLFSSLGSDYEFIEVLVEC